MTHIPKASRALFACTALLFTACTAASDRPDVIAGEAPWHSDPLFGNFAINGTAVVTNQDGSSPEYMVDYVDALALPASTFNGFAIRVYVPTSQQHSTRLAHLEVSAGYMDSARTGNIYTWAEFVERTTLDAQLYSAYEITAAHRGSPSLDASTFANVVFEMSVKHLDAVDEGNVVSQRPLTVEIYKR